MMPTGAGQRTLGKIGTAHRQCRQRQLHLRVLTRARRAAGGRGRQCVDLRVEAEGVATGNTQQATHMPHALRQHRHAFCQIGDAGAQVAGLEGMRGIFLAQRGLPEHMVAHAIGATDTQLRNHVQTQRIGDPQPFRRPALQVGQHLAGALQGLQGQRTLAEMEVGQRLAQQALAAQAGRRFAVHCQLRKAIQRRAQAPLAQHQPGGVPARQQAQLALMPAHCLQGLPIRIFGLFLIFQDQQRIAAGTEQTDLIIGAIHSALSVASLLEMLQSLWPSTNQHPARIRRKTFCVGQRRDRCKVSGKDHAGLSLWGRSKRQQAPNSLAQTIVCSGSNRISLKAIEKSKKLTLSNIHVMRFSRRKAQLHTVDVVVTPDISRHPVEY